MPNSVAAVGIGTLEAVLLLARRSIASVRGIGVEHRLGHLSVCVCVSVGLSICLSGKCTVAKRLIVSGCRLGW